MKSNSPWDQRLARLLVRPIAGTAITPNQVTTVSLTVGLVGAGLMMPGDPVLANWGALFFMIARLLDHCDGELARMTGRTSRFGYIYDYAAGCLNYCALFVCLGIGLREGLAGAWSILLGLLAVPVILATTVMSFRVSEASGGAAEDYPAFGALELEDGIYLIGPIVWFGWIDFFFLCGSAGVLLFGLYTAGRYLAGSRARA